MTARNTLPMDPKLLAILTGELGNNSRIGKICADLGAVFAAVLPELIETETNLKFAFAYEYCETGLKDDLIADLDDHMILIDGSLKNWCTDFTIACPSQVIVAMVECLLGGDPDALVEPVSRRASSIELEMAPMVTDKIASVLKSAVSASGNCEPDLSKPYNAQDRPKHPDNYVDPFAAQVRIRVEFGALKSHFCVIVPHKNLLKTTIRAPRAAHAASGSVGWTDLIKEQVRRSDVRVEARIRLTPLRLGAISRLQPGDVIPFLDKADVSVQVSANGRDLYDCEFGRAGEHYTVRVKDTIGGENDLLKDLMAKA
ncbi:MAG: flagellar motor switch protein FliM [Rhizobiaceae bacterium]|nr:flagellar motor switch protein FliM [Rhizobiaceae bacterium]